MEKKLIPWGDKEKDNWRKEQTIKRSYLEEVVTKIKKLDRLFDIFQYGALPYDEEKYPLYLIKSKNFSPEKRTILITGGVHGYETSGVHGALAFLEREASNYKESFNFIVAPCIGPWGYETINRWNPMTVDPNRSFYTNGPAPECNLVMKAIADLGVEVFAHFDLHETTDTDNTIFRPALEKRDGIPQEVWDIPDGFYLVADSENPCPDFQKAIINSVRKVTHIAPADKSGKIIGATIEQEGVINYALKKLHLCASFSNAIYSTTTEVYPDSPKVSEEDCVDAQVAAIVGGLDHLLTQK
ncbi:PF10994 domain protein [Bacteriovorax sp. BAL6_X]|uniref:M14 family metallopeptidase n=1 Tax=Bacteriovorax sp. BAL6_X TaxID=1201290 RepID=UPI000386A271|nr:M14 family metallocarboxypeptidase [Bacteriovorax sp. BAL6_X]EPZ49646.1 PF10994 domain protein [Bacteriovorax sp. BAL6_X]